MLCTAALVNRFDTIYTKQHFNMFSMKLVIRWRDTHRWKTPELSENEDTKFCILCGEKGTQLCKHNTWGQAQRQFLWVNLGEYPPNESYTCKKHLMEAKQHYHDTTFIPKWKRVERSQKCCIRPHWWGGLTKSTIFGTQLFKGILINIRRGAHKN